MVKQGSCNFVDGKWVFQSAAFDNATPQDDGECPNDMSVVLSDTLKAIGRDPRNLPLDSTWGPDWAVAVIRVAPLIEDEEQKLYRTPDEHEPAHGDVCGPKGAGRRRRIKKAARWLDAPKWSAPDV